MHTSISVNENYESDNEASFDDARGRRRPRFKHRWTTAKSFYLLLIITISLNITPVFQIIRCKVSSDPVFQTASIYEVKYETTFDEGHAYAAIYNEGELDEDHSQGERRGLNLNNRTSLLPLTPDNYAFDTTNFPANFKPEENEMKSGRYLDRHGSYLQLSLKSYPGILEANHLATTAKTKRAT